MDPPFKPFRKLPPEIRNMIWTAALPGPRVIPVQQWDGYRRPNKSSPLIAIEFETNPIATPLSHVCKESRSIALSRYEVAFEGIWAAGKPIYIDWKRDTLYVTTQLAFEGLQCHPKSDCPRSLFQIAWESKVQHLAIADGCLHAHKVFGNLWRYQHLSHLQTLTFGPLFMIYCSRMDSTDPDEIHNFVSSTLLQYWAEESKNFGEVFKTKIIFTDEWPIEHLFLDVAGDFARQCTVKFANSFPSRIYFVYFVIFKNRHTILPLVLRRPRANQCHSQRRSFPSRFPSVHDDFSKTKGKSYPKDSFTQNDSQSTNSSPPAVRLHNSTNDLKTFTKFRELPPELRLIIWEFAMPAARLIQAIGIGKGRTAVCFLTRDNNLAPPAILHACYESREFALKTYTPITLDPWKRTQPIFFAKKRDTLYFETPRSFYTFMRKCLENCRDFTLDGIHHIGFSGYSPGPIKLALEFMGGLESIFLKDFSSIAPEKIRERWIAKSLVQWAGIQWDSMGRDAKKMPKISFVNEKEVDEMGVQPRKNVRAAIWDFENSDQVRLMGELERWARVKYHK
ncbi:hypothetical protein G7Y89_g3340 [Cudoniella acicularis]|uniref:2EXR domain-containing protein n=1 Tax=Cudoniella acicularis TaxID=354080 RepID=A0A8H4W8G9_9HELO|nr:hypothetical protein G7Y89_g3340 [Cudoniella acicularis]